MEDTEVVEIRDLKGRLAQVLLAVQAVEFGEFTLASGMKSDVYVNIKRAVTRPTVLALCANAMSPHAAGVDRIAGVELGAVPLAVAVSLETGLPFVMVRKEPKGHGTGRMFEGDLEAGDKVLLVEDVTTTAGSSVRGVGALREAGAHVDTVVVVVDRGAGGAEALNSVGVRLIPLLTLQELREQV
jgi:orotate phosphoribosyltransferase